MAIINDTGIISTSLSEYKSLLDTAFLDELGADLDLAPHTPQSQIIGIFALNLSQLDDAIVQDFNQLNIYNAAGNQLDGFGATFGISRVAATYSIATVDIVGAATTVIAAGTRAKTTLGDLFAAVDDITIGGGGTATALFQAVDSGDIAINANTLIIIVDVVPGWDSINNPDTGDVGESEQSDIEYRESYFAKLSQNAIGTVAAINAAVRNVDNVVTSKVFENDTDSNLVTQGVTLLPHSIAVIVDGGESQEIGDAIYLSKTAGANTEGDDTGIQTAVVVDTGVGAATIIYYYPVEFILVDISITITQYFVVPDVSDQIKEAIVEYFSGTFSTTLPGIGIADPSYLSRLYTPINSLQGFDVTDLSQEISGSGSPETVITPDLNQQLYVTTESISVAIS